MRASSPRLRLRGDVTLVADARKGNGPSLADAASKTAEQLDDAFVPDVEPA